MTGIRRSAAPRGGGAAMPCVVCAGMFGPKRVIASANEPEKDYGEEHALRAVDDNADQGALVPLRRIGDGEGVDEHRPWNHPRHVKVVAGEQDPVRQPVLALEDTVHAREQEATEEQLL